MNTNTMIDVAEGMFWGGIIFCILLLVGAFLYIKTIDLIEWSLAKYWNWQELRKRNNHRVKCGLPKLKKLNDE